MFYFLEMTHQSLIEVKILLGASLTVIKQLWAVILKHYLNLL